MGHGPDSLPYFMRTSQPVLPVIGIDDAPIKITIIPDSHYYRVGGGCPPDMHSLKPGFQHLLPLCWGLPATQIIGAWGLPTT